jgi:endoglucanase
VQVLDEAIGRMQRAGLTVVVALHPTGWHLEDDPSDRVRLFAAWASLAPVLASHDPRSTVAELLNEPVFAGRAAEWQALQHRLLRDLRLHLPRHPVLLSGNDWSSIAGLLAMTPESDPEVLYGVHFYDPVELTSLAAWRPGLDRAALARLPFPAADDAPCRTAAADTDPETAGVIRYYCAQDWDPQRLAVPLAAAAAWGRAHGVRVLVGEFGATAALNPAARSAWLAAVRDGAEHAGLGWALWGYDDIMGLAVPRPPGGHPVLDSAVLRALGLRVAR